MKQKDVTFNRFPEHKAARERLVELQLQQRDIDDELRGVDSDLAEQRRVTGAERLAVAAQAMIDGDTDTLTRAEADLLATRSKLENKQRVTAHAVEIQRKRLKEIEAKLSAEICAGVQPEYTSLVKSIAKAATELSKLVEQEQDFRDALRDAGIMFTGHLPVMNFRHIGLLRDEHSYINHWLKEAKEYGYL